MLRRARCTSSTAYHGRERVFPAIGLSENTVMSTKVDLALGRALLVHPLNVNFAWLVFLTFTQRKLR